MFKSKVGYLMLSALPGAVQTLMKVVNCFCDSVMLRIFHKFTSEEVLQ